MRIHEGSTRKKIAKICNDNDYDQWSVLYVDNNDEGEKRKKKVMNLARQ